MSSYYYDDSGVGTGGLAAIIIVVVAVKIGIISCIIYACRRKRTPYFVAPNTTTVATVVNANNQMVHPNTQYQMPMSYPPPQYITNPQVAPPNYNPPQYPDTSPTAVLVENQA